MRCLCCGKEITDPSETERKDSWHSRCASRFFGVSCVPKMDLSAQGLSTIVTGAIRKGLTVPGVQKKLSLHLSKVKEARLTLVDYPTGYILKPQAAEYERIPEAEALVMKMAAECGIRTVPNALLRMDDTYAYITRRVDRIEGERLAMEDLAQLSNRLTRDKYRGSYERCAEIIKKYSTVPGIDLTELFMRLICCFITGNSDMHLKNFSLLEGAPGSRQFRLSPAYDLLPVNLLLPEDEDQTALTLNGKKRHLHRGDFIRYAGAIGIERKVAERLIDRMLKKEPELQQMIRDSYLSEDQKLQFEKLMAARIAALQNQ